MNAYLIHVNGFVILPYYYFQSLYIGIHLILLRAPGPGSGCFLFKPCANMHNRVLSYERALKYLYTGFQVASGRLVTRLENPSWDLFLVKNL